MSTSRSSQTIPSPAAGSARIAPTATRAPAPKITVDQLLAPLKTPIRPIEVTPVYNLSVFFVAIMMVLLPLVYVAIVGCVAMMVLFHTINNAALLQAGLGGMFFYALPIAFGGVFVLFMIKPLFAPPGKRATQCSLKREQEPVLFAFVDQLCHAVGAPSPVRIDVNNEPNASAGLRRGFLSLFSDDLVLTIGLPLAAGFSLPQLAGVLAHEFGHFTQGSAMRFGYIVNSINRWFARVVYERDAWDEHLKHWSEVIPVRAGGIILLALRFMVWLSRGVLWGLMHVAHMLSCFMLRQMEYDADRHETRVAGSEVFTKTSIDLHVFGWAWSMAMDDLDRSWMEQRLGDDLSALVMANVKQLRERKDAMEKINKAALEEKTGWFDTHPATSDRIAMAKQEFTHGIFNLDLPAHILFRDFRALCKATTLAYYNDHLDDPVEARHLVPTETLVAEQAETNEAHKTLYRYFQGKVLGSHEIFLPAEARKPPANPRATVFKLRETRERMMRDLEKTSQAVKRFDEADERLRELSTAWVALEAGFSFEPARFKLRSNTRQAVHEARQTAETRRESALTALEEQFGDGKHRLVYALQLLRHPQVIEKLGDDAQQLLERCTTLLATMSVLQRAWPNVLRLREVSNVLFMLLHLVEGNENNASLFNQIERLSGVTSTVTGEIRDMLQDADYPFQHADGLVSVGDYALKVPPDPKDLSQVMSKSTEVMEKLVSLYFRSMAHLAVIAERVEGLFGLAPLPEPPDEDEEPEANPAL